MPKWHSTVFGGEDRVDYAAFHFPQHKCLWTHAVSLPIATLFILSMPCRSLDSSSFPFHH
jgi:hypothetical protein